MPDAAHIIALVDGVPRIVDNCWRLVDGAADWDGAAGAVLPLELALAQSERLRDCGRVGIWLAPSDDPARAVPLFPAITLIGIQFPKFTDGRGYSSAALLRSRHGWRGELRALGDVLQDQLYALRRVGFDSFALRADRDPVAALRAFSTFSDSYQGSVEPALPAFRRQRAADAR